MREFPQVLGQFAKEHSLNKNSLIRLVGALSISALSGIVVIFYNNETYWNVTINRVQTVDFNILANVLPNTLSKQLLTGDKKGLQTTLDSNYGLFGMVVTDCKSDNTSCPKQKIIYASKAKVNMSADGKQKLELQRDKYPQNWAEKLIKTDYPAQQLTGDFLILRDPPPLKQEWKFDDPRVSEKTLTGEQNVGNIIGRVYLLRGSQPSFQSELQSWSQNPLKNSSKNFIYNAIVGSAIFTGLIIWLLTELTSYIKTNADKKELEAEKKISEAAQIELIAEKKAKVLAQKELEIEKKSNEIEKKVIEVVQRELTVDQRIGQVTEKLLLANQDAAKVRARANKDKEYADSFLELESKTQQEKIEVEQRAFETEQRAIEAEQRAIEVEEERQQIIQERQQLTRDREQVERDRTQNEQDRQYILEQIDIQSNELNQEIVGLRNTNNQLNQDNVSLRNTNNELKHILNAPPASHRDTKIIGLEIGEHHQPKSWHVLRSSLNNLIWVDLIRPEKAGSAPMNGIKLSNQRNENNNHIFCIYLYESEDTRMKIAVETTGNTEKHAKYTESILRDVIRNSL
jgi:hypothetical protein